MDNIYFDNAATTFPKPDVVYEFMDKFYRECGVNAGRGSHKLARKANELIDNTRKQVAELVMCDNHNKVIFTPTATIAINEILNGIDWTEVRNVYVTPFEHNAIMRTLHNIGKIQSLNINVIPFDSITFELDENKLKVLVANNKPDLVIMSLVSNVTGYILPVKSILNICEAYNPITLLDCCQGLGLVEFNIKDIKVDFVVFAGHKTLYGPFGISGYISMYNRAPLKHYIFGGTGSDSTNLEIPLGVSEVGSHNIQSIAGLYAAIGWLKEIKISEIYNHKKELTKAFIEGLRKFDEVEIYTPKNLEKHIGIVSFNIKDIDAADVATILDDEFDILVRSGHHCCPLIGEFLGGMAKKGTVRISIGYFNTIKEIHSLLDAIENIIRG